MSSISIFIEVQLELKDRVKPTTFKTSYNPLDVSIPYIKSLTCIQNYYNVIYKPLHHIAKILYYTHIQYDIKILYYVFIYLLGIQIIYKYIYCWILE